MSDNDKTDEFLKDLQKQCIVDAEDHFNGFRAALLKLGSNPGEAFTELLKSCHSLKGNLQAVGFLHCAEFVHDFEAALLQLQEKVLQPTFSSDEIPILEFLLSDACQSVEMYMRDLSKTLLDEVALKERRKVPLNMLQGWQPTVNTAPLLPEVAAAPIPTPIVSSVPEAQIVALVVEEPVAEAVSKVPPDACLPDPRLQLFLLFKNGKKEFAINISHVKEIVQFQAWTSMPVTRPDLLGLLNLRGEVIPVLNINEVLGGKDIELSKYVVVCQHLGAVFGFPVESADRVIELPKDSFQNGGLSSSSDEQSGVLKEFSLIEGKTILVLDIAKAVAA